jgi:GxxExxY protein
MKEELLYKELTYQIIGAAMEVHQVLGSGFLESVYQAALEVELSLRKIPFQRQVEMQVIYKDQNVGHFRLDLLVDQKVLVEWKAQESLGEAEEGQILNYLRGTGVRVGLLLNFGASSLQHKRFIV